MQVSFSLSAAHARACEKEREKDRKEIKKQGWKRTMSLDCIVLPHNVFERGVLFAFLSFSSMTPSHGAKGQGSRELHVCLVTLSTCHKGIVSEYCFALPNNPYLFQSHCLPCLVVNPNLWKACILGLGSTQNSGINSWVEIWFEFGHTLQDAEFELSLKFKEIPLIHRMWV